MTSRAPHVETTSSSQFSLAAMCGLLKENRSGRRSGIYSVCSAHRLVIEAAIAQAIHDRSPLLIEATCNQVNQEGGYIGQTPAEFRDYVYAISKDMGFSTERLILGVETYLAEPVAYGARESRNGEGLHDGFGICGAGFTKIHLDRAWPAATIRVYQPVKRLRARGSTVKPPKRQRRVQRVVQSTIIGTEVPTRRAQEEMEIEVTSTESLQQTIESHREAFERRKLLSAWERIVGVVVQPEVEFGHEAVAEYVPEKASKLTRNPSRTERGLSLRRTSTDYQERRGSSTTCERPFWNSRSGSAADILDAEAIFGAGSG